MTIVVQPGEQLDFISEFLDFNKIDYLKKDMFDEIQRTIIVPVDLIDSSKNLIIIDYINFTEFFKCDSSFESLKRFVENPENRIWVSGICDFLPVLVGNEIGYGLESLSRINEISINKNISFYLESPVISKCYINELKNIQVKSLPVNWLMRWPRIHRCSLEKNSQPKEFLLTAVLRSPRVHRFLLKEKIQQIPDTFKNSTVIFHTPPEQGIFNGAECTDWVGETPHQHSWFSGYPSMDLYRNHYVEIVPETLYDFGNFITEKTIKPIATKTPFLALSTPGYLAFLRENGFQTFGSFIDENYDNVDNLQDRIDAILVQINDIHANGVGDFYRSCKDILTHNHDRLLEITGRYQYEIDQFLMSEFDALGDGYISSKTH